MRVSRIRGLPVLDSNAMRSAGAVSEVVLDLLAHRAIALDIRHGDGLLFQRVPIEFVDSIDPHVIRVRNVDEIALIRPQPFNEQSLSSGELIGLEVLNAEGDRVGRVQDVELSSEDLAIESITLGGNWSWDRAFRPLKVTPRQILACSTDAMLVDMPTARRPALQLAFNRKP